MHLNRNEHHHRNPSGHSSSPEATSSSHSKLPIVLKQAVESEQLWLSVKHWKLWCYCCFLCYCYYFVCGSFFVLLAIVYCSDCYWWSNCDTCGSWSNISAEGPYSKVCNILNQTFCIGCTFLLPALLKYASRRTEGVCAMCINHQNHKNLLSRGIFVKNILC